MEHRTEPPNGAKLPWIEEDVYAVLYEHLLILVEEVEVEYFILSYLYIVLKAFCALSSCSF